MKSVGAAKIQVNFGLLYRAGIRVHVSIFFAVGIGNTFARRHYGFEALTLAVRRSCGECLTGKDQPLGKRRRAMIRTMASTSPNVCTPRNNTRKHT